MTDNVPHFDDAGRLVDPRYDDVYFSAEDGLAETQHVFLQGNGLADRFAAMKPGESFTIGETGFGTGLNLLAAWQLFEQHAPADATLHFVSVEGFPLDAGSVRKALSVWPAFTKTADAMLAQWGGFGPGVHRLRFAEGRVRLTLLVGEAVDALALLDTNVDAWFLDGFAPSRNPAMWSKEVLTHVGRCSTVGTTLATYTAAGFVRRGLQSVGYEIEKQPGFGTKRDMTVGRYVEANADAPLAVALQATANETETTVVIGGSIAGAFAARSLAERGVLITVLDRQSLSSGELPSLAPRVAVLQPKINDMNDAAGRWLREGYADVYRRLSTDAALAERAGWQACGTFQAAIDERSTRRLRRFVDQFGASGLCRWVEPAQTLYEVGVALPVGGVLVERAGLLRPAALCAALLDHPMIQTRENTPAISLQRDGKQWVTQIDGGDPIPAQRVIVAIAMDAGRFEQTKRLELRPVRGQVTLLRSAEQVSPLTDLRRALFYGGYLLPVIGDVQTLGASFVPREMDTHWRDEEHADVCDKLARLLPEEAEHLRQIDSPSGWVGLRATTPNHRCYAQEIEPGLYTSLGHGSHGIASAAAAGEHLATLIAGGVRIA